MSDSYQAIYDAVCSKIGRVNSAEVVAEVAREKLDISYLIQAAQEAVRFTEGQHNRPSVLYRPTLSIDGNQWLALYGENIAVGVCGFGDSPELAMGSFDAAWAKKIAANPTG